MLRQARCRLRGGSGSGRHAEAGRLTTGRSRHSGRSRQYQQIAHERSLQPGHATHPQQCGKVAVDETAHESLHGWRESTFGRAAKRSTEDCKDDRVSRLEYVQPSIVVEIPSNREKKWSASSSRYGQNCCSTDLSQVGRISAERTGRIDSMDEPPMICSATIRVAFARAIYASSVRDFGSIHADEMDACRSAHLLGWTLQHDLRAPAEASIDRRRTRRHS